MNEDILQPSDALPVRWDGDIIILSREITYTAEQANKIDQLHQTILAIQSNLAGVSFRSSSDGSDVTAYMRLKFFNTEC